MRLVEGISQNYIWNIYGFKSLETQEWAGWRGGEEGSKSLPPVPSLQGEDLWAFWDQVVIVTDGDYCDDDY